MIDPHVHLRDWNQADKETLVHGFSVAWHVGISGVFEMPNTDPPLTGRAALLRRIADADRARDSLDVPIFHGIYAGITANPRQIEEIVRCREELFPRVVGFKLFAGHSTGNMGVISATEQQLVWNTLASLDYRGVVAVHAESEELLRPTQWNINYPFTHGAARPVAAEEHSVRRQFALAEAAGFRGSVHICHVTTPTVLDIIVATRPSVGFSIRAGVTPHHLLLNEDAALRSAVPEWKVNPPLRNEATRRNLWERLQAGDVDWVESDHAPHTWRDKQAGASGVPGLPAFRMLRDLLREHGTAEEVERLTHGAVLEAFAIPDTHIPRNPRAESRWDYATTAGEYPWDPYRPPAER
ncbi:MAG: dihydroorotase [Alkalispirochaeta sp.]